MSAETDTARLQWLTDCEQLRQLPQRYARAVDFRDNDALSALFDPNGNVSGMRGDAAVPDYLAGLRDMPKTFESSMHAMGEPLIDLAPGADEGATDTYAVVYQVGSLTGGANMTLGMRYVDQVKRSGDGWVIHQRTTSTIWMV